jgi:hypothetical protein
MSLAMGEALANKGSREALITKAVWSLKADEWFQNLAVGTRFSADDLTDAIGFPDAFYPNSNNAIGAKIRHWSNQLAVARIGFIKSTRTLSHARMIAWWEKI